MIFIDCDLRIRAAQKFYRIVEELFVCPKAVGKGAVGKGAEKTGTTKKQHAKTPARRRPCDVSC